jgi:hypothetical protein
VNESWDELEAENAKPKEEIEILQVNNLLLDQGDKIVELEAKINDQEEKIKNQADEIVERELEWFCVYEYHAI